MFFEIQIYSVKRNNCNIKCKSNLRNRKTLVKKKKHFEKHKKYFSEAATGHVLENNCSSKFNSNLQKFTVKHLRWSFFQ